MNTTPHIVWRGLDSSAALEQHIRHEVEQMDKAYRRISSCRVVVERPHRHHRHGGHFHIKIEMSVPGRRLTVSRNPAEKKESEDAYAAVNGAFSSMRRQLEDYIRIRRGL